MKIVLTEADVKELVLQALNERGTIYDKENWQVEISSYSTDFAVVTQKQKTPEKDIRDAKE